MSVRVNTNSKTTHENTPAHIKEMASKKMCDHCCWLIGGRNTRLFKHGYPLQLFVPPTPISAKQLDTRRTRRLQAASNREMCRSVCAAVVSSSVKRVELSGRRPDGSKGKWLKRVDSFTTRIKATRRWKDRTHASRAPCAEGLHILQSALPVTLHRFLPHSHKHNQGIVPDDAAGRWVFSRISRFPHFIPELLHSHLISTSSALKISLLRVTQFSYTNSTLKNAVDKDAALKTANFICDRLAVPLRDIWLPPRPVDSAHMTCGTWSVGGTHEALCGPVDELESSQLKNSFCGLDELHLFLFQNADYFSWRSDFQKEAACRCDGAQTSPDSQSHSFKLGRRNITPAARQADSNAVNNELYNTYIYTQAKKTNSLNGCCVFCTALLSVGANTPKKSHRSNLNNATTNSCMPLDHFIATENLFPKQAYCTFSNYVLSRTPHGNTLLTHVTVSGSQETASYQHQVRGKWFEARHHQYLVAFSLSEHKGDIRPKLSDAERDRQYECKFSNSPRFPIPAHAPRRTSGSNPARLAGQSQVHCRLKSHVEHIGDGSDLHSLDQFWPSGPQRRVFSSARAAPASCCFILNLAPPPHLSSSRRVRLFIPYPWHTLYIRGRCTATSTSVRTPEILPLQLQSHYHDRCGNATDENSGRIAHTSTLSVENIRFSTIAKSC
ncbi:hypothetical protein PR048_001356 [Dryococelus australis]|uniref:Uncharacterized protein n=1 Tax=Dryococelus australis TaxID=614101 RepID=A0ABQ9IH60_9NEOP|nr:hypothetical protein PR048_001356 [Dryococelus australis]